MGRDDHHRDSRDYRDSRESRNSRDSRDRRDRGDRDRRRDRDRSRSRSRSRSRDRSSSHRERDGRYRERSPIRDSRDYGRDRMERDRKYYQSRHDEYRSYTGQFESVEKKGLNVEVHPLLASSIDPTKMQAGAISLIPKASTSTTMANQRAAAAAMSRVVKKTKKGLDPVDAFLAIKPAEPSRSNPYFDHRITSAAHKHTARAIKFQPKGKFVAQANQMRREAQMEVLRRDIAETALESGLDVDIVGDLMIGDASVVPRAEWWDLPFLLAGDPLDVSRVNHDLVNNLIQRPVLLDPPADLNVLVAPKPLALTKEELKKMRRQRRLAEHQEHQEKIRLGLIPPGKPKIRLANLATVLANESVQDPTKIEAEIRAQAAARHEAHLKANQERKEHAELASKNKPKLDLPLVHVAVYQVDRIDHNQWKYKIKTNAIQDGLTGCAIISPKTNIIVVEGAPKGLKHYKGLLTRRINWNEPPKPIDGTQETEINDEPQRPNLCKLLWEGAVAKASWSWFETKEVQADIDVKDYFVSKGLEQYWNLTRS